MKANKKTKRVLLFLGKKLTFLVLLGVGLIVLAIFGGLLVRHPRFTQIWQNETQDLKIYFMVWRLVLMAIVIYFYPLWLRKWLTARGCPDEDIVRFTKRRWIILVFILYEVLVVHNALSPLINWLLGT